jgi:hypothetical protein
MPRRRRTGARHAGRAEHRQYANHRAVALQSAIAKQTSPTPIANQRLPEVADAVDVGSYVKRQKLAETAEPGHATRVAQSAGSTPIIAPQSPIANYRQANVTEAGRQPAVAGRRRRRRRKQLRQTPKPGGNGRNLAEAFRTDGRTKCVQGSGALRAPKVVAVECAKRIETIMG